MENVSDLTSLDITYNGGTKTYVRHMEEKKDDDSDSTTQEISYTCGDETIDKSTFTTFYSSLIGLKAQTKDESLVQAKDAEFTAVFHMTDGDLTFAYSPYDSLLRRIRRTVILRLCRKQRIVIFQHGLHVIFIHE